MSIENKLLHQISSEDVSSDIYTRTQRYIQMNKRGRDNYAGLVVLLQWGIPILSAILTAIASGRLGIDDSKLNLITFWLGLIITILTVANSTIRPAERFARSAAFYNEFSAFRTSFILERKNISLSGMDSGKEMVIVNEFLMKKEKELAELVSRLNSSFMPVSRQSPERAAGTPAT